MTVDQLYRIIAQAEEGALLIAAATLWEDRSGRSTEDNNLTAILRAKQLLVTLRRGNDGR